MYGCSPLRRDDAKGSLWEISLCTKENSLSEHDGLVRIRLVIAYVLPSYSINSLPHYIALG
jgi:hypothetical protein